MSANPPAIRRMARALLLGGLIVGSVGCAHLRPVPFRFVQMCDPQLGFGGYEADLARFKQAVKQINELNPDFVLICGDLVNATDRKSLADFKAAKAALKMPCYCAPGNHDLGNTPTPQTLARYRQFIGRDHLSFDHKGFTFVVADAQLWRAPVPVESERQDAWFKRTLAAAAKKGRAIFVVAHYPLFVQEPDEPDGYFNLPIGKRKELLAEFEQYGVVALLAGHTHTTLLQRWHGIQIVAGETTSRNFDQRPLGFRLWHVSGSPPYPHEFLPLKNHHEP